MADPVKQNAELKGTSFPVKQQRSTILSPDRIYDE